MSSLHKSLQQVEFTRSSLAEGEANPLGNAQTEGIDEALTLPDLESSGEYEDLSDHSDEDGPLADSIDCESVDESALPVDSQPFVSEIDDILSDTPTFDFSISDQGPDTEITPGIDGLSIFLKQLGAIPLLTPSEEVELGRALKLSRQRYFRALLTSPFVATRAAEELQQILNGELVAHHSISFGRDEPDGESAKDATMARLRTNLPTIHSLLAHIARLEPTTALKDKILSASLDPAIKTPHDELGRKRLKVAELLLECGLRPKRMERFTRELGALLVDASLPSQRLAEILGEPLKVTETRFAGITKIASEYHSNRSRLINSNLRLAVSIARTYNRGSTFHSRLPLEDLINSGNIGLTHAADKWDVDLGFRFSTYATHWIHQAIRNERHDSEHVIGAPKYTATARTNIRRAIDNSFAQIGREPTNEEIATQLNLDLDDVSKYRRMMKSVISLDMPVLNQNKGRDTITLGDELEGSFASPMDSSIQSEAHHIIREALESLEARDRDIIRYRYGMITPEERASLSAQLGVQIIDELTLEQVGALMSVTRERIRQIQNRVQRTLSEKLDRYAHLVDPGRD